MDNLKITTVLPLEQNTIFFMKDKGASEVLKLCENGDIFVKGRLAENDKEVVDALREFLKSHGFLK
jgi:cytosine/adenosine deaminase-related metal-dependent hydrolase